MCVLGKVGVRVGLISGVSRTTGGGWQFNSKQTSVTDGGSCLGRVLEFESQTCHLPTREEESVSKKQTALCVYLKRDSVH